MARDTRRGKTASGGWTQKRRDDQAARARRQHRQGKLSGGKKTPSDAGALANVSGAEALRRIIADRKSKPGEVMRAVKELRLLGVIVPDPTTPIETEIVDAIETAIYPLIGIGLALGGPVRERMRDWLGEDFSDDDEEVIVGHMNDTLKLVGAAPYFLAEIPLGKMLREDFPPLNVLMEIRAGGAARGVVLAHAPEEEANV